MGTEMTPATNVASTIAGYGLTPSPAKKAGIEAGDVITAVDGAPIKDARDLAKRIGSMAPKASVKLAIWHKGAEKSVTLTLGELPNQQQAQAGSDQQDSQSPVPRLGLSLAPAKGAGAGNEGVVVTAVDPNGPAAEQGIKAGDVITNVGGTSVSTPSDVQKQLGQLQKAGKHSVLMRVKSGDTTHFVALPLATG